MDKLERVAVSPENEIFLDVFPGFDQKFGDKIPHMILLSRALSYWIGVGRKKDMDHFMSTAPEMCALGPLQRSTVNTIAENMLRIPILGEVINEFLCVHPADNKEFHIAVDQMLNYATPLAYPPQRKEIPNAAYSEAFSSWRSTHPEPAKPIAPMSHKQLYNRERERLIPHFGKSTVTTQGQSSRSKCFDRNEREFPDISESEVNNSCGYTGLRGKNKQSSALDSMETLRGSISAVDDQEIMAMFTYSRPRPKKPETVEEDHSTTFSKPISPSVRSEHQHTNEAPNDVQAEGNLTSGNSNLDMKKKNMMKAGNSVNLEVYGNASRLASTMYHAPDTTTKQTNPVPKSQKLSSSGPIIFSFGTFASKEELKATLKMAQKILEEDEFLESGDLASSSEQSHGRHRSDKLEKS